MVFVRRNVYLSSLACPYRGEYGRKGQNRVKRKQNDMINGRGTSRVSTVRCEIGVWKEMRSTNVGLTEGRTMYRNTDSPFPPYYISPPNITLTRARAIISLSLCARCLSAPLTQVFNTRKPQPAPMCQVPLDLGTPDLEATWNP